MDKNKFQIGNGGKTGKAGIAIAIILAIIGFGLRFMRTQARQERRESQSVAISKAQAVQSVMSSLNANNPQKESANSVLQSIAQAAASSSKTSNGETIKYDKYTPVDGTFSLGQIGTNFYVVDPKTQQRTPLDNATAAYVIEIDNKDKNSTFGAIVAKVNNEWLVFVNEAKKLGSLGDLNITEKTRRVIIKNGDATVE